MMSDRTNNYDLNIDGDFKGVGGSISGGEITQNIHTDNSKSFTYNRTEILQISEQEIISRKLITASPYKGLRPFDSFYAGLLAANFKQEEAKPARQVEAETLVRVVSNLKQNNEFWFIFID